MVKLVVIDDAPPVFSDTPALVRLRSTPNVELELFDSLPSGTDETVERIATAHTVLNVRASTNFDYEVLSRCGRLRHLALWGSNTGHVDLESAQRFGITVTNTPGIATASVAEHALALLLAIAHRVRQLDYRIHQGEWPRGMITQLHGKTLGILGAGRVGQQMAAIARGIGMNVITWTRHPELYNPETTELEFVDLPTLLADSDAISIHLRGSQETYHIIGSSELSQMKPSAFIINTSRGDMIDELALEEALRGGALAGAGLDTFESEPLSADNPLRTLPNALLSPHTASTTDAALASSLKMVVDNVLSFLDGDVQNQVHFDPTPGQRQSDPNLPGG
ncbi:MAG TPA: 2-hydroxyacid dehydrogenase [Dehalococcoidia bacterium]|nr:2-hydroxyacid dehydrogenase [Dehalococcoidia bacterium]MDP7161277.1 2-hydroxyacid dehydrogenase [Dehalococcoidia bacterium]MDP7213149.1 2-hydroxyacid dehydrogenase [Dehalococcoidia bacterium]MDP7513609.1 2-hydroxyacid dehydrogenase [Dehalococcoidia bacterium]HJM54133.1 2-hydroxyacid dehydrogenase [Dehalococcoidia bacterium]